MLNRTITHAFCLAVAAFALSACDTGKESKDFTVKGFWTFETTVRDAECPEWRARVGEEDTAYRKVDQRAGVTRMHILDFMGVNGLMPGKWGSIDEFRLEDTVLTGPIESPVSDQVRLEVADTNRLISSKNYRAKREQCMVSYSVVMRKLADSAEAHYAELQTTADDLAIGTGSGIADSTGEKGYKLYRFPLESDDWVGVLLKGQQVHERYAVGVYDADGRLLASHRAGDTSVVPLCEREEGRGDYVEETDICFDRKVLAGGSGMHFLLVEDISETPHQGLFNVEVLYLEDGENVR